jgi:hypothetical protein
MIGSHNWLSAIVAAGLRQPDAMQVSVNQGAEIAAGQYKSARALVFLDDIAADTVPCWPTKAGEC